MKYLLIIVAFVTLLMAGIVDQKQAEIKELKRQIENMHSIQRWQESIIRDCGFYGKEP